MKLLIVIFLSIGIVGSSFGQKERSLNRAGVKNYISGEYNEAEVDFLKALEEDSTSFAANYNRAASLYKLEKYKEANEIFAGLAENMESSDRLPDLLHNLGNNLMKQEMYEQSIEAYKNSLRMRSDDEDSRYNLAYAQVKLKQQEEDKDKDKDKDKNKDENKDENKDQQDKEDKEDQKEEDKEDQKDQQNQEEDQKEQEQKQQEQTKELSQEDIERILQAIQEQEKDVKEKVEKQKAKAQKVKTEKDW